MNTSRHQLILNAAGTHLFFIVTMLGLFFISRLDFLVFHLIAEIYSIIIAASIFAIMWASRRYMSNNYFLIIGIGLIFAALIDFLHALSYKGMPFFSGFNANLPTQFWIAARYLQAGTFVIAPFFTRRKAREWLVLGGFLFITSALVFLIFSGNFPDSYIESQGLTPFKIISEYIIVALLLVGLGFFISRKSDFDQSIVWLISASIIFSIFTELVFTLYVNLTGPLNILGHFLKDYRCLFGQPFIC